MGVVFLICVPTANYERILLNGFHGFPPTAPSLPMPSNNNLNNNGPGSDTTNTILKLEVELRDKNLPPAAKRLGQKGQNYSPNPKRDIVTGLVPMEKVLDELLKKLEIEHVIWNGDKNDNFYQVIFPLESGIPCETTLHCLTELGIGVKLSSTVSVMPCSVSFEGNEHPEVDDDDMPSNDNLKWKAFVDSIKSKLTVKQVVDGVRAGGALSFDYLLLVVTACSLAALGLVENNAPNITAAMLVSPLMGPVMSITFGTIISDRELVKVGFISLSLGMFISCLFGFIFGLILGTTEMPWGFGDFPTEEMKGRGNARSLWMGIMWALTSGSGVAVALLQGSAGPLIGVAISASLLPPVVNCGLFWALACIWLIYPDKKLPHVKGEPYFGNSSYQMMYTNYIPTEFLISGIVSGLLTVINVICIFITAILVLKIKEVAAPYIASPDLKRFWDTDIRVARKANQSTIRRKNTVRERGEDLAYDVQAKNLGGTLERALREALDDDTFRKVKRMSYSSNAAKGIRERLGIPEGGTDISEITGGKVPKSNSDLMLLDKLVSNLLESNEQQSERSSSSGGLRDSIINRFRPFSRSLRLGSKRNAMPTILESNASGSSNRTNSWGSQRGRDNPVVHNVLNTIRNAPQRFSHATNKDESSSLTGNILE
uniref:CSON010833 protein n=1 Tax=Culicoides sonorensis TaxID=179676 RepID=A0A336M6G2_CULSO